MTTILLVRHGESEANKTGVFAGCRINPPLTEKGLLQAERYAEYAVSSYKIDAVYSSPLSRAYNTGKACADRLGLEIIVRDGVREIDGGAWEGYTLDEIANLYKDEFEVWMSDIAACQCPEGESVREMGERVLKALTEIALENSGKTVLVATHYTPVRAMQTYVKTGSFDRMSEFEHIPNTSLTELFYDGGEWKAGRFNINSYLEGIVQTPLGFRNK